MDKGNRYIVRGITVVKAPDWEKSLDYSLGLLDEFERARLEREAKATATIDKEGGKT